jgi:hypothetical protein
MENLQPWEKEFVASTKPVAAIFEGATRVECFRMMSAIEAQAEYGQEHPTLLRLPYTAKAIDRNSAFATRLGTIVLSPTSYEPYNKACTFNPAVGFRVVKGKQNAVALVCFGCDQLLLVEEKACLRAIKANPSGEIPYQMIRSCESARPELLQLAREVFPADTMLQALNDIKSQ